jgi:F-type H+-transporting ATPase subunit b
MLESLGVNLPLLISFIVNFLILLTLLIFVLYRPVLKMLDERSAKIKESLDAAENMKTEAAEADEQLRFQLESGRKEAQAIIASATQVGEKLKAEAKEEARKEAEAVAARAKAEIKREREATLDQLRKEVVNIAILAAEKVVRESMDTPSHRKVIEQALAESQGLKKG